MKRYIVLIFFILGVCNLYAQNDTLVFKDGTQIIGEIKNMSRGVIVIGKNWYVLISANYLQNDEQKLKLRLTPKTGIGNYIIQTNSLFWGVYGGAAWNNETYTDPTISGRSDVEANIGTELNLFDMGDLGLLTTLSVHKSIKEGDRMRADFKFDIKYDLPLDFYIKLGYTHNYDSSPVEGASENDYIFQTTFDWEL